MWSVHEICTFGRKKRANRRKHMEQEFYCVHRPSLEKKKMKGYLLCIKWNDECKKRKSIISVTHLLTLLNSPQLGSNCGLYLTNLYILLYTKSCMRAYTVLLCLEQLETIWLLLLLSSFLVLLSISCHGCCIFPVFTKPLELCALGSHDTHSSPPFQEKQKVFNFCPC